MKILLADDEKSLRVILADDLTEAGHDVRAVADGREALAALQEETFACVLTDLSMPGVNGFEVLKTARELNIEVIVITGVGSVEEAVAAMKQGAFDFVQKPFLSEELLLNLERLAQVQLLRSELERLRTELGEGQGTSRIVGDSPAIQFVIERIKAAARTDVGVLIMGESGTGKEVVARALHEESSRARQPLVVIPCGVLADTLLEDELFGHEKGAFTGANYTRLGRFEEARAGTVFLDDIDDMPLATQVKLLRVLQEKTIERLGSTKSIRVDARVVAATKKNLDELVRAGDFREDLFYRLNILAVNLPPLRQRLSDIPLLVAHFIHKHAGERNFSVASPVLDEMQCHNWKGNVRQLENSIIRAISLAPTGSKILELHNLLPVENTLSKDTDCQTEVSFVTLADAVRQAERVAISQALVLHKGNRTQAAKTLAISRKHLWQKMKQLDMEYGS